jgi:hypothetical protein
MLKFQLLELKMIFLKVYYLTKTSKKIHVFLLVKMVHGYQEAKTHIGHKTPNKYQTL